MRPVNLIPSEERRGERRPLRSGPLAYIVVGALAAALIGVTLLVVTDNQISDRKAEVTQLEGENGGGRSDARSALAAYTQFHSVREQRVATMTSLADSRFDWERVMRELSLILPVDVWLTNLDRHRQPGSLGRRQRQHRAARLGPRAGARDSSAAPPARRRSPASSPALKDIDGVTRVGVESSSRRRRRRIGRRHGWRPARTATIAQFQMIAASTPHSVAEFQIVAAFDAARRPLAARNREARLSRDSEEPASNRTDRRDPRRRRASRSPSGCC